MHKYQEQPAIIVPEHDRVMVRLGYSFENDADRLEELMCDTIALLH